MDKRLYSLGFVAGFSAVVFLLSGCPEQKQEPGEMRCVAVDKQPPRVAPCPSDWNK